MPQTRRQSLIEAGTNIVVGLGLAYVLNMSVLALLGTVISHRQNILLTIIMTAASLARSYALRRCFNRWHQ